MFIRPDEMVLVTGAAGFIGPSVVRILLQRGFPNLRLLLRSYGRSAAIKEIVSSQKDARIEIFQGDLLSPEDCAGAAKDVSLVYHLAMGSGEESFDELYVDSAGSMRNLLDACRRT